MNDKIQTCGVYTLIFSIIVLIVIIITLLFPGIWRGGAGLSMMTRNQRYDTCVAQGRFTHDECLTISAGGP